MTIERADDDTATELTVSGAADPVTAALAEVTTTNTTITQHLTTARELAATYKDVAFDVTTTKGMDDARKARAALRDNGRFPIQHLQKAGSKLLGTMQQQFNARCKEVIAEIVGYEKPIDDQITAEEERKENERKAREEAEAARVQAHMSAIATISGCVAAAAGETSAEIAERIQLLTGTVLTVDDWEEFVGQATQARDEAVRQLNGLLLAARAEEAELAEARAAQALLREAQEAEQTRLAQERDAQAARQRELDAQAARMREQQEALDRRQRELDEQAAAQQRERDERAAAVQKRLDDLIGMGESALASVSDEGSLSAEHIPNLRKGLERLHELATFSEAQLREKFDTRVAEAQAAIIDSQRQIQHAIAALEEYDARIAADKRAAEVQENIDNMLAVADIAESKGYTTLEMLDDAIKAMAAVPVDADNFGERVAEADEVKAECLRRLTVKREEVVERDRKAAAEAEERRKQEEAQAEERALLDAKRSNGEVLYALVREAIILLDVGSAATAGWHNRAQTLVLHINPKETFDA